MKTTNEISKEQYDKLVSFSDEKTVGDFLTKLNTKYGGGEVLQYEHMFDIFSNKYFTEQSDWLTTYVDTVRMLRLANIDGLYILETENFREVEVLHYNISRNINASEEMSKLYVEAIKQFLKLNQTISGEGFKARFELIATAEEMQKEGSSMEHCIASYVNYVASGQYIALRVFEENTNGRFTLGLYRNADGFGLVFDQLKGKRNYPANAPVCLATVEFCKKNNIKVRVETDYDLFPIRAPHQYPHRFLA